MKASLKTVATDDDFLLIVQRIEDRRDLRNVLCSCHRLHDLTLLVLDSSVTLPNPDWQQLLCLLQETLRKL